MVRGAAELHSPEQSSDGLPEIAFSVEAVVRRRGVGSSLFQRLIAEARLKGYGALRITTSAENQAMRALAGKFGAQLTFRRRIHRHHRSEAAIASRTGQARDRGARRFLARGNQP